MFARHNVFKHKPNGTTEKHVVDSDEVTRHVCGGHHSVEGRHRQTHVGENLEAHGQSGETVSTFENESKKLTAVHTRHTSGHLPAA